ncbi:hypothetical protein R1sor_001872 [Riccia sorocarpa]|uniref:Aminotransferase-like plant mobile domain-containing protein n=1 Tax=Riccia sorocarpa TaxID=122646 RepID=A0ABD3GX53_9MARC
MGGEEVGRRMLTVKLMGPEISQDYCSASTSDIIRNCQFIPYSFKELNQVDIVEFSALQSLKMVKYVTGLQRYCLPTDVFFWTIFNTDAEGDRVVIKGANGNANVIGWPEIAVAFGAHHDPQEELWSNKVMQSKLRDLQPELFLPQAVESNPNKKLVNGQRYEECLYYREAAPYGPTYYLMTIIAEIFWSAGRAPRFLTPMVYAYLRSLNGHQTNWAKAILNSLRTEIVSLQNRGKAKENPKARTIMWAPVLVHIVYAFRSTIFAGTPLQESEQWLRWSHLTKDGDMTLSDLEGKFPDSIGVLAELHERCQIPEQIPIASPVHEDGQTPMSKRAPTADGKCRTKITLQQSLTTYRLTRPFKYVMFQGPELPGLANNQVPGKRKAVAVQEDNDPDDIRVMPALDIVVAGPSGSPPTNLEQFGQLLGSEIANLVTGKCSSFWLQVQEQVSVASLWKGKHEGLLRANTELSSKMAEKDKDCLVKEAEWKKTVAALRDELASVRVADGLAIEGFQMQKQVLEGELKRLKNSSTPVVEGLKEKVAKLEEELNELEAKQNALTEAQREIVSLNTCSQPVVDALKDKLSSVEAELSCKTLAGMKYKKALDSEIVITSELQFKIEGLDDEINKLKFALERADASSKIARVELSHAKKDLRLLQLETDNDMALSGSSRS